MRLDGMINSGFRLGFSFAVYYKSYKEGGHFFRYYVLTSPYDAMFFVFNGRKTQFALYYVVYRINVNTQT